MMNAMMIGQPRKSVNQQKLEVIEETPRSGRSEVGTPMKDEFELNDLLQKSGNRARRSSDKNSALSLLEEKESHHSTYTLLKDTY